MVLVKERTRSLCRNPDRFIPETEVYQHSSMSMGHRKVVTNFVAQEWHPHPNQVASADRKVRSWVNKNFREGTDLGNFIVEDSDGEDAHWMVRGVIPYVRGERC